MYLQLLGTEGCHLCEDVCHWLLPLAASRGWTVQYTDIALAPDSEALISRYGIRIPVLRAGERELDYPFDETALLIWLER